MVTPMIIEEHPAQQNDSYNVLLALYDEHVQAAARKAFPRRLFASEILDLEIDEFTQAVRIKLWQTLEKQRLILNPKAYIYRIAYTGAIDLLRRHKPTVPLLVDEYGELVQDILLVALKQEGEALDPARLLEEQETLKEYTRQAAALILLLPPQQRLAIMCWLKDLLEDTRPFTQALSEQGMNLDLVHWPAEKEELHRLKASASIARKKLRSLYMGLCA